MTRHSVLLAILLLAAAAVSLPAGAAPSPTPVDPVEDQLRSQVDDIVNTPVDFCDPATRAAHFMAMVRAIGNLTQHQLANHHPRPGDIKSGIDKTVQDARAEGDLVEDLPHVIEYEEAERRGDEKAQVDLLAKMTPAAKAQVARHDHDLVLAAKLLTPLAEAGDIQAELNLAGIYDFDETALSPKYLPPVSPKFLQALGKHWPPLLPPENLPLAFRYYRSAAAAGNAFGQWGLARAYACGFGTGKDLVLAYMWFSLGLAQRGVTDQMTGVSLPPRGPQKEYALDRDFITARMKPAEIAQARALAETCKASGYVSCNRD